MKHSGRGWLIAAGVLSACIAVLHIGVIIGGPPAYVYFGAGELAPMAAAGSPMPALITAGLVLVFGVWSWYALAGAGVARRPPLLLVGLWTIGAIYAARGLALAPELLALSRGSTAFPPRFAVFSLVSLTTGLAYLIGTWRSRATLRHAASTFLLQQGKGR